jgi:hypothetical protein
MKYSVKPDHAKDELNSPNLPVRGAAKKNIRELPMLNSTENRSIVQLMTFSATPFLSTQTETLASTAAYNEDLFKWSVLTSIANPTLVIRFRVRGNTLAI